MKNGCCWAATELRYWMMPSSPESPVPWEFMKRPSLLVIPPPSSVTSWLAPASWGFQRVKPYWLTSSVT
jgi:hypothetical protein